jgi:hypothetical protein
MMDPTGSGDEDRRVLRMYMALLRHFGLENVTCMPCTRALLPAPFNLESYTYTALGGPSWTWDVGSARALIAARRPPARSELIDPREVSAWLEHHGRVDQAHLAHIPPSRLEEPILVAPAPDGRGQVLIDGSHRATVRVANGLPLEAYLLTDEESALATAHVPVTMRIVRQHSAPPWVLDELSGRDGH